MIEAAETIIEAMIPGQAVAEEHLVVGTVEMITTEEVGTAMKTNMTDTMIILGMITGVIIVFPQRPKLNLKPQTTPKEDDSSASTFQSC